MDHPKEITNMTRKPEKTFAARVVAALDKRVRVDGKWVSKRELILLKLIELTEAKDVRALKLLLPEIEKKPSSAFDIIPTHPEVQLAFARAAKGK